MPKIGFSTSCLSEMNLLEQIEFANENNIKAIEIFADSPECWPGDLTRNDWRETRKNLNKYDIEPSIHAPIYGTNIGSLNTGIAAETMRQIRLSVDLAVYLGGSVVVIHGGRIRSSRYDSKSKALKRCEQNITSVANYANKRGAIICIENIGAYPKKDIPANVDEQKDLVEAIDNPALKCTLDNGHANAWENMERAFNVLGDHIRHIHLADNFGSEDDHLPIGKGNIDFSSISNFLNEFDYQISLEITDKKNPKKGVLQSIKNIKEIIKPS